MSARKLFVLDSMGRDLGAAMTASIARPFAGRFPLERIEARARPDWRAVLEAIARGDVAAVVYSGSKAGVYEREPWIAELIAFTRDLVALEPARATPVLGICFGHQLLAEATAGPGAVEARPPVRRGIAEVEVLRDAPIFAGLPRPRFRAVITHQDHVARVGAGFDVIARADYTPIHAQAHRERPIFGVQSHPEHGRATFDVDEREYAHRHWACVPPEDLARAEGPRILDAFADLAARLDATT
jgi:GMP synthase (glutamine-hydrolysing)